MLEELGAAGCPLLMMIVSPAICGTVIARFGTDEQRRRWLRAGRRLPHHGVRDHRARRGLQRAPHHHHRPPHPRRLDPHRPQGLRVGRRHRAVHARRGPHRGRAHRQAEAACSWWTGTRPASTAPRSPWNSTRGRSSSSWSSTTCGSRRMRARRRRGRGPPPALRRAEPGADHDRRVRPGREAGTTLERAVAYAKERQVAAHPIGARRRSPTRWPRPASSWSAPRS